MTITNQDISIYRGDTAVVEIAVTQADGSSFDTMLPGVQMKWRMATTSHALDGDALARKETGSGLVSVPGGVELTLAAPDSDQMPGLYYHELKVYNAGDVFTAMTGNFIIRRALRMGSLVAPLGINLRLSANVPTRTP